MTELTINPLTPSPSQWSGKKQAAQTSTGFSDILEMLNPLQHLPVISHLYRAESGNDIPAIAKIIGAGAFGGVIGAVGSAAVSLIEGLSGEPILQMATSLGGETHQPFATMGEQQVVQLLPDNGEAFLELSSNPQIVAQAAASNAPAAAIPATPLLRDLRKSEIGLPESSIEAQLNAKLMQLI